MRRADKTATNYWKSRLIIRRLLQGGIDEERFDATSGFEALSDVVPS